MDNDALERWFDSLDVTVEGTAGNWQISLEKTRIICLTDERHNRMRFIAPIRETKEMCADELTRCLEANFHTALDIKYAISDGVLWSTFTHPLAELSEPQARDALEQVYNGVQTYGRSYSSTNLSFQRSQDRKERMH